MKLPFHIYLRVKFCTLYESDETCSRESQGPPWKSFPIFSLVVNKYDSTDPFFHSIYTTTSMLEQNQVIKSQYVGQ